MGDRTSVSSAQDDADPNGVLVDQVDGLLGVDDEALGGAVDQLLLDLKVPRRLFPADLDSYNRSERPSLIRRSHYSSLSRGRLPLTRRHDNVGPISRQPSLNPLILPPLPHGQHSQKYRLRRPHARRPDGASAAVLRLGGVEEAADHGDAAVLDVGALGVLFVVDEVLGKGLSHELLCLLFLVRVSLLHCLSFRLRKWDCNRSLRVRTM